MLIKMLKLYQLPLNLRMNTFSNYTKYIFIFAKHYINNINKIDYF